MNDDDQQRNERIVSPPKVSMKEWTKQFVGILFLFLLLFFFISFYLCAFRPPDDVRLTLTKSRTSQIKNIQKKKKKIQTLLTNLNQPIYNIIKWYNNIYTIYVWYSYHVINDILGWKLSHVVFCHVSKW